MLSYGYRQGRRGFFAPSFFRIAPVLPRAEYEKRFAETKGKEQHDLLRQTRQIHRGQRAYPVGLRDKRLLLEKGRAYSGRQDSSVHFVHARPFQRSGRRLCRLRHLPRVQGAIRPARLLQRHEGARGNRAILKRALRHSKPVENPHAQAPENNRRAAYLAVFRFAAANQARGFAAGRKGIRGKVRDKRQPKNRRRLRLLERQEYGRIQSGGLPRGRGRVL